MPVTYSYAFEEKLMAYLRKVVQAEPREQAFEDSPTFRMLEKKPVSLEGNYIQVNVSHVGTALGGPYAENTALSTADVESGKVAQFEGAFYAEPARISHIAEKKTQGGKALFNLWAFKIKQAKMRLRKKISEDIFATSQVTDGLTGFPLAIPATNTSGTYGGLNRATRSWWRNYSSTSVGAFTTNGPDEMDLMELGIQVDGGRGPDWYVTTKALYQKMKKYARSGTVNFDPTGEGRGAEKVHDMGIKSIFFNNTPVFWDPYCDSGKIYAVRDDALYMGLYENWDLSPVARLEGSGVQGKVIYVRWGGQILCEEQRRVGQLSGVT